MNNQNWKNEELVPTSEGVLKPRSYLEASFQNKNEILNGCGPEGYIEKLVPDSILGLDVSASCNTHDWTYHHSKNEEDHKKSDELFLRNLENQIKKEGGFWSTFRKGIARLYYFAVRAYSSSKVSDQ